MKPFYQKLVTPPSQSVIIFDEEKPHFTVPWHFHPEIEILYVVKSSGTSYIGDCINSFSAGDITIIGEATGTESKAKEMGKYRLEGKNYIAKDGDIFNFRFSV